MVKREERNEDRSGGVEGWEDVLLRATRLHGVQDGVEPHARRKVVLVAVGEVDHRSVARDDHVERVGGGVDDDHAERKLGNEAEPAREKYHRQHVRGQKREVTKVEEGEPLGGGRCNETIHEERRPKCSTCASMNESWASRAEGLTSGKSSRSSKYEI
jgi:hypothetical protein